MHGNLSALRFGAEASTGRCSGCLLAARERALFLFERFVTIKQIPACAGRAEAQTGIKCDPKWPWCAKAPEPPGPLPEGLDGAWTQPGLPVRANPSQPRMQAATVLKPRTSSLTATHMSSGLIFGLNPKPRSPPLKFLAPAFGGARRLLPARKGPGQGRSTGGKWKRHS